MLRYAEFVYSLCIHPLQEKKKFVPDISDKIFCIYECVCVYYLQVSSFGYNCTLFYF